MFKYNIKFDRLYDRGLTEWLFNLIAHKQPKTTFPKNLHFPPNSDTIGHSRRGKRARGNLIWIWKIISGASRW